MLADGIESRCGVALGILAKKVEQMQLTASRESRVLAVSRESKERNSAAGEVGALTLILKVRPLSRCKTFLSLAIGP